MISKVELSDKFEGCFLGLAFGDAICAAYEGGIVERVLWKVIGQTKAGELRFTDDTQMSLDVARSFIREGYINQEKLAKEFSSSYKWSRGYGPGAAKILKRILSGMSWDKASVSVYKDGSYGNGAAMRAPILAMCCMQSSSELNAAVVKCSQITHSHALAIEGALLIAHATAYALLGVDNNRLCDQLIDIAKADSYKQKLDLCQRSLQRKNELNVREVKNDFGNGMTADQSCVTAIYLGLRFREKSFVDLLNFIKKLGGDTDTIAAMAGAIWGAINGAKRLQLEELPHIEMQHEIQETAVQLYGAYELKN